MSVSQESKQAAVVMRAPPSSAFTNSLMLRVKEETNVLELQADRHMHQAHVATAQHKVFSRRDPVNKSAPSQTPFRKETFFTWCNLQRGPTVVGKGPSNNSSSITNYNGFSFHVLSLCFFL